MLRELLSTGACAACALLVGCSPANTRGAKEAGGQPSGPPLAIDCKLTDGSGAVVMEGQSFVDTGVFVTLKKEDASEKLALEISRQNTHAGGVFLHVHLKDWRTRDGREIVWQPNLWIPDGPVTEGVVASSTREIKIDLGGGDARTLRVTVHPRATPPGPKPAEVASIR